MANEERPIETCEDLRCACGNLLARLVPAGVELRCRRCKRHVVLPLETGEGAASLLFR